MATPGVLIALEGIDGVGKSTQAKLLAAWVQGLGREVVSTREPTNGPFGTKIRESRFKARLPPKDELEAFVADRREHVTQEIAPALARGAFVIIDRYYYSTVAYQGARGLSKHEVLAQNRAFAPTPDVVLVFDLEPQAGLERIHGRGEGQDLFESLGELQKAREIFQWLSRTNQHLVQLDVARTIPEVHTEVVAQVVRALWPRLPELELVAPTKPEYALLHHAQALQADASLSAQERMRRLLAAR